jgi:hypothetical protein
MLFRPATGILALAVVTGSVVTGALLWRWPVFVTERLPSLLIATAATFAITAAGVWLCRLDGMAAAFIGASCLLRLTFVLHPAFPAIDALFHAHNIHRFQEGEAIASAVSDSNGRDLPIPYPPALYALLAVFVAPGDYVRGEFMVRLAMGLFEATSPLLIWGLMRKAGGAPNAAAAAAATAAVMPEGMLVLAKGIAANIVGSWFSLAALVAAMAPVSVSTAPLLAALALLAHPGAAVTLAMLLTCWAAWGLVRKSMAPRVAFRILICLFAAGLLAWVVYYRAAAAMALATLASFHAEHGNVRVRWVHIGKILQDTLLKFGGVPLAFVAPGMRAAPQRLRSLLQSWFVVAGLLALLAILSPMAFRFEYFILPAVALAAGGALASSDDGRLRRWAIATWVIPLAIQTALAVSLFAGWFDPINVIIPGERWPLFGLPR